MSSNGRSLRVAIEHGNNYRAFCGRIGKIYFLTFFVQAHAWYDPISWGSGSHGCSHNHVRSQEGLHDLPVRSLPPGRVLPDLFGGHWPARVPFRAMPGGETDEAMRLYEQPAPEDRQELLGDVYEEEDRCQITESHRARPVRIVAHAVHMGG